MDIFSRIREQYDEFNKAQLRIADYILQHPEVCGFASLRQFAAATDTTSATVLSFSRRLGFDGFAEMKIALQKSITKYMMPIRVDAEIDTYSDSAFEMTVKSEQESLQKNFEQIDPKQYEEAVKLIQEADCIYTFAYDFSPVLAEFFTSRFKRLGLKATDLSHLPLTDALHSLAMMKKTDLLVLFSFPVYSKIVVSIAEYFRKRGYRILCFTDSEKSPAAKNSSIALTSPANHIFFFNSMTPTIASINTLASMFLSRNKEVFDRYRADFDALQDFLYQKDVLTPEMMDPAFRKKDD